MAGRNGASPVGKYRSLACACPSPACPVACIRNVLQASQAVRVAHRVSSLEWPLLVARTGRPLQKTDVVRFYKDVAELIGCSTQNITGHSARVCGAMRMAAAGHPLWTIQVFGRWGSSSVRGYVRDAILGVRGGTLAAATEAHALSQWQLRRKAERGGRRRGALFLQGRKRKRQVLHSALEASVDLLPASASGASSEAGRALAINDVMAKIRELEHDLRVVSGESCPNYIQCSTGLKHRAVAERTICGWAWRRAGGQPIVTGPSESPNGWCTRCLTGGYAGKVRSVPG